MTIGMVSRHGKSGSAAAWFLGPMVFSLLAASSCSLCDNQQLAHNVSPARDASAFIFLNRCGATVRDSRQVTLTRGLEPPAKGLFEDVVEQGTVFRVQGEASIDVEWTDKDHVTITYRRQSPSDHVFKAEREWQGISVTIVER